MARSTEEIRYSVWKRIRRWALKGVFERIFASRFRITRSSTIVKVHRHGKRRIRTSKSALSRFFARHGMHHHYLLPYHAELLAIEFGALHRTQKLRLRSKGSEDETDRVVARSGQVSEFQS